jgi:drug/metabolite transporter (DMT)-like permease
VVYALGAALGFGTFFVVLDQGSAGAGASPVWAVGGARLSLLATLLMVSVVRPPAVRWPGRRIAPVVAAGLADTLGTVLFAYAARQANLGVVAVLGSLYPVVTVLLGRILLAERLTPSQHTGVVLALGGVALLAAG